MKKLTKKERFQENVLSRFHVYNSIFATLPYDSISNTGNLLPVFTEFCKLGYSKKLDPKTIVEDFFLKYCETYSEEDKISLIFRFIQYIERQVVLFDAIEDASFTQINNMDGVGTLRNLKELGESSNKQKELKKYLRSFKIKPVGNISSSKGLSIFSRTFFLNERKSDSEISWKPWPSTCRILIRLNHIPSERKSFNNCIFIS